MKCMSACLEMEKAKKKRMRYNIVDMYLGESPVNVIFRKILNIS